MCCAGWVACTPTTVRARTISTTATRRCRPDRVSVVGDVSTVHLNQPVIGAVATPTGRGYYLFAADGGIFAFGDATFHGSTGAMRLNRPITAMAVTPGVDGYLMVGQDGGAFSFGGVFTFFGSLATAPPPSPVVAVALHR